jgi:hypothetical protein
MKAALCRACGRRTQGAGFGSAPFSFPSTAERSLSGETGSRGGPSDRWFVRATMHYNGRMRKALLFIVFVAASAIFAKPLDADAVGEAGSAVSATPREYALLFGGIDDPATFARTGVNINKAMTDAYYYGIGRILPPAVDSFAATAWQVWWSFMMTLWPHEFGHWSRARQIGGEFVFERLAFPWPVCRMDLPASRSLTEDALASVGGFEINSLMRRLALEDFYSRGYSFADELIHSFIQGIYYPGYALAIAQLVHGGWIDPCDPDTWINTVGDPVESTLVVYRNFTGRPPITGEGEVDQELATYYWESLAMSVAWTLIDPALYQGARGFGTDMRDGNGLVRPRMFGDDRFSWMYGTMFNSSPLGYELYLIGRFLVSGTYASAYLKYGRPFLNLGAGLSAPALFEIGPAVLGASADYWYEGPYGHGLALGVQAEVAIAKGLSLAAGGGWKSAGYLLGMPLGQSFFARGGLVLGFEPNIPVKR